MGKNSCTFLKCIFCKKVLPPCNSFLVFISGAASCSFNKELCLWKNGGDFDWKVGRRETTTLKTGPKQAVTKGSRGRLIECLIT